MLSINNLHVAIGDKAILKGLTLDVPAGEVHAVMGPNGAGKSTLGYALSGRPGYEATEGSVAWKGEDLLALDPSERAARGVFLSFQYPIEIPGVPALTFVSLLILDETDSGLDIDALRIVSEGVNAMRSPDRAMLVITHYQRLLDYIKPDRVHVLVAGRIVASGGPELAHQLEAEGYDQYLPAAA